MPKHATNVLRAAEEQTCQETIQRIAQEILAIETLESRGHDRLDFYDLGVASVRSALHAAYLAGRQSTTKHHS